MNGGWSIIAIAIAIDKNECWWDPIATENSDWALFPLVVVVVVVVQLAAAVIGMMMDIS